MMVPKSVLVALGVMCAICLIAGLAFATYPGRVVETAYGGSYVSATDKVRLASEEKWREDVAKRLTNFDAKFDRLIKAIEEPPSQEDREIAQVKTVAIACSKCHDHGSSDQGGDFTMFSADGKFLKLTKTQHDEISKRMSSDQDAKGHMPPKKTGIVFSRDQIEAFIRATRPQTAKQSRGPIDPERPVLLPTQLLASHPGPVIESITGRSLDQ